MTAIRILKVILYGVGVFIVFTGLMVGLNYFTHHKATPDEYFGLFSDKNLLLGAIVAVFLTFSHERKKR